LPKHKASLILPRFPARDPEGAPVVPCYKAGRFMPGLKRGLNWRAALKAIAVPGGGKSGKVDLAAPRAAHGAPGHGLRNVVPPGAGRL